MLSLYRQIPEHNNNTNPSNATIESLQGHGTAVLSSRVFPVCAIGAPCEFHVSAT